MATRTITVRGVSDADLRVFRQSAKSGRRSLNSELLEVLHHASTGKTSSGSGARASPRPPVAPTTKPVEFDRAGIAAFCRRHHIRWFALFGSHARGEATIDSDVDIVVEFEPGHTPGFGIVTIAGMLANLFGGHRVDLVTLRGLSPRIRERVLSSARVLYGAR